MSFCTSRTRRSRSRNGDYFLIILAPTLLTKYTTNGLVGGPFK